MVGHMENIVSSRRLIKDSLFLDKWIASANTLGSIYTITILQYNTTNVVQVNIFNL